MTDVEAKLKRKVGAELDVSDARAREINPKPKPIPKIRRTIRTSKASPLLESHDRSTMSAPRYISVWYESEIHPVSTAPSTERVRASLEYSVNTEVDAAAQGSFLETSKAAQ
jgi:hypothetical protein